MSDEIQEGTTQSSPKARKKRGPNKPKTVEVPLSLLDTMQRQIAALQAKVETQDAKRDFPEVDVPRETTDGRMRQPGEVFNITGDPSRVDLRQVRWNRQDIIDRYPMVEVTPEMNLLVAPHGVYWQLLRRRKQMVPSIVKDLYEAELSRLENPMYVPVLGDVSPMSPLENAALAQQAVLTGQKAQSRVHFIGTGLDLGEQQAEPATATS